MGISLLICDDHEVIRSSLVSMLANTDIEIVGEAADGKESLKQAIKLKPDVVLLDVRMPEGNGLEMIDKIKAKVPTVKIVMFSTHDSPTYIARAIALGATGYVLKGSSRDDMVATIRAAAVPYVPIIDKTTASFVITVEGKEVEEQWRKQGCWE